MSDSSSCEDFYLNNSFGPLWSVYLCCGKQKLDSNDKACHCKKSMAMKASFHKEGFKHKEYIIVNVHIDGYPDIRFIITEKIGDKIRKHYQHDILTNKKSYTELVDCLFKTERYFRDDHESVAIIQGFVVYITWTVLALCDQNVGQGPFNTLLEQLNHGIGNKLSVKTLAGNKAIIRCDDELISSLLSYKILLSLDTIQQCLISCSITSSCDTMSSSWTRICLAWNRCVRPYFYKEEDLEADLFSSTMHGVITCFSNCLSLSSVKTSMLESRLVKMEKLLHERGTSCEEINKHLLQSEDSSSIKEEEDFSYAEEDSSYGEDESPIFRVCKQCRKEKCICEEEEEEIVPPKQSCKQCRKEKCICEEEEEIVPPKQSCKQCRKEKCICKKEIAFVSQSCKQCRKEKCICKKEVSLCKQCRKEKCICNKEISQTCQKEGCICKEEITQSCKQCRKEKCICKKEESKLTRQSCKQCRKEKCICKKENLCTKCRKEKCICVEEKSRPLRPPIKEKITYFERTESAEKVALSPMEDDCSAKVCKVKAKKRNNSTPPSSRVEPSRNSRPRGRSLPSRSSSDVEITPKTRCFTPESRGSGLYMLNKIRSYGNSPVRGVKATPLTGVKATPRTRSSVQASISIPSTSTSVDTPIIIPYGDEGYIRGDSPERENTHTRHSHRKEIPSPKREKENTHIKYRKESPFPKREKENTHIKYRKENSSPKREKHSIEKENSHVKYRKESPSPRQEKENTGRDNIRHRKESPPLMKKYVKQERKSSPKQRRQNTSPRRERHREESPEDSSPRPNRKDSSSIRGKITKENPVKHREDSSPRPDREDSSSVKYREDQSPRRGRENSSPKREKYAKEILVKHREDRSPRREKVSSTKHEKYSSKKKYVSEESASESESDQVRGRFVAVMEKTPSYSEERGHRKVEKPKKRDSPIPEVSEEETSELETSKLRSPKIENFKPRSPKLVYYNKGNIITPSVIEYKEEFKPPNLASGVVSISHTESDKILRAESRWKIYGGEVDSPYIGEVGPSKYEKVDSLKNRESTPTYSESSGDTPYKSENNSRSQYGHLYDFTG
jgi:hypothetical protein